MDKNTKLMAAVGCLLLVLVLLPGMRWGSIVGIVLFLWAMNTLSKAKNEPVLFREALLAFLIPGIGGVLLGIIGGIVVATLIASSTALMTFFDMKNISATLLSTNILTTLGVGGVIVGIIGVIVGWIFAIVHGIKMQKVSLILESHLNTSNFSIAGTLFFWGGWLTPLLVGVILLWAGWLLYTIAFFSLPQQ